MEKWEKERNYESEIKLFIWEVVGVDKYKITNSWKKVNFKWKKKNE
jgi:hypothetical protein